MSSARTPATTPTALVAEAVTVLFVPGDRPDRFAKAAASGADVVIIDLEDAVAPADKAAARSSAVAALESSTGLRVVVRINDPDSDFGQADLAALSALVRRTGHGLLGAMVPKAARSASLASVVAALSGHTGDQLAVVGLVETARGVADVGALAATPGLTRLAFGALDFALDIGAAVDALTGQLARAEVIIASRAAGLPAPLESPATELKDTDRIEASSRAARQLGFGGRLCIHPAQLEPVRAGFAPTPEEVDWARTIAETGESAARVDDHMVDRPVLERARRILRLAGAHGGPK